MNRYVPLYLALAFLAACQGTEPTTPRPEVPSLAISDGAHTAGNPDFFFLPPLVWPTSSLANWTSNGFNPSLSPSVEICPIAAPAGACTAAPVVISGAAVKKHFPPSADPSDQLTGLPGDWAHYHAKWKIPNPCNALYRVAVKVGTVLLGYSDVKCVTKLVDLLKVDYKNFGAGLRGLDLQIPFRIEKNALCWPATNCTEQSVNLGSGGTVILTAPNSSAPVAGVRIPVQTTPQTVEVTVKLCEGGDLRARAGGLDLPVFGACFNVTTIPAVILTNAATVFACNIVVNNVVVDPGIAALSGPQQELVTLHRFSEGTYQALPHAPDFCNPVVGSNSPKSILGELAQGEWKSAGRRLLGLFAPEPLYARRRIDQGGGGLTNEFSDFQFALPARMEIVGGSPQTGIAGGLLPVVVKVTDLKGGNVAGARVHLSASTTPALSDAEGRATYDWAIALGSNSLTVTGNGIGGDDPNNGPRAGQDPFQPLDTSFGDPTDGGRVTLSIGARTLVAQGIASTCGGENPCGEAPVNLSEGGTVEVEVEGEVVGGVVIPPQPGEPAVVVTVEECPSLNPRAIDLPVFGRCLTVTTTPALAEALAEAATVYVCDAKAAVAALPVEAQRPLVTLHRLPVEGAVQALPHADAPCPVVVGQSSFKGMLRALVQGEWRAAGRQLVGLLAPKALQARMIDQGGGGITDEFSDFQFALPAKMAIVASTNNQTGAPGAVLAANPTVLVTDLLNNPVSGATVHFQVQTGGGSPASDVGALSNGSGLASTAWTLGPAAGDNTLQASGRGIASPGAENVQNGPRTGVDPFIPLSTAPAFGDASNGPAVDLGTGTLMFSATGVTPPTFSPTPVFASYGSGGWSYQIDGAPPVDWYSSAVTPFGSTGSMPFGSPNAGCTLNAAGFNTSWPAAGGTFLYARKSITLAGAEAVRIAVAIDNDVQVFVDGTPLSALLLHEGCPTKGSFVFNTTLAAGSHLVGILARDRGTSSYLDVEVTGTGGTITSVNPGGFTLTIGGSGVAYTAQLYNSTGSAFGVFPSDAVVVQAWIDQGTAFRAAGGAIVGGGGTLPAGSSSFGFSLSAENSPNAGSGTLVPGPATARFELTRNGVVLHTFTLPVTLQ